MRRDGTDPSLPEAFGCARDQAVRASRSSRAWIRTLRAMTYIFGGGAMLLFAHVFVRLIADAPPAEHQSRKY